MHVYDDNYEPSPDEFPPWTDEELIEERQRLDTEARLEREHEARQAAELIDVIDPELEFPF